MKGNCAGCGKEGIIHIIIKGSKEKQEADKEMDKAHTLVSFGEKYPCCNIWCYLKAKNIQGQMTIEGDIQKELSV